MITELNACDIEKNFKTVKNLANPITYESQTLITLERFSIERRKTKTKVITLANHQSHKHYSEPIKTRSN